LHYNQINIVFLCYELLSNYSTKRC